MHRGEIHSEMRYLSSTCFVSQGLDIYFQYLDSLDQLLI